MAPREVLLDTNALLLPHQSKIDIFAELERLGFGRPLVPKGVLRELESVAATGNPRDRTAARIGMELATTRCEIIPDEVGEDLRRTSPSGGASVNAPGAFTRRSRKVLPGAGPVDDLLVKMAVERGLAVATNDKELKRRLKKVGVPLVYPRKKVLEMAGMEL